MPYIESGDGTRLAYQDYGAGAPIVFLAGSFLNGDMWEYQVPFFLDRGYRCLLLDRRGHGRSDRPRDGYDLDTRADDLASLVEHLDLRDCTLVAHSAAGGELTRYLARHGARRVARVAFLASGLPFVKQTGDNPHGVPEEFCEAVVAEFCSDRPTYFANRAQGYFATHLGNLVSQALIDNEVRQCLSASPMATVEVWRAGFHTDHRAEVSALTLPALVIHGAADQSAPVELTGRRLAEMLPHCVYKEYPNAGHGLYVTHAQQVNTDLLEFISGPS